MVVFWYGGTHEINQASSLSMEECWCIFACILLGGEEIEKQNGSLKSKQGPLIYILVRLLSPLPVQQW